MTGSARTDDSVIDPIALAQALIRRPSVTPEDAGALDVLQAALAPLGFACHRLRFQAPGTEPVDNLFARIEGKASGKGAHFCFAGHTDVVPVGDAKNWTVDPFLGTILNGRLFGRGAADMKGAVAAFAAAAAAFLAACKGDFAGSIALLITGDEEGPAINGTKPVLDWIAAKGLKLDACLVGEPTNPRRLGEMVKIGRRGNLTGRLAVAGVQGHIAYPHLADNPIHRLARMALALIEPPLDSGTAHFEPSTMQFASIDVGNPATNIIPGEARAVFNSRYNDSFTADSLEMEIRRRLDNVGGHYRIDFERGGDAFLTEPGALSGLIQDAVEEITGAKPVLSTTGGTSDARFIRAFCPVVEFGLTGETMHKVDENVRIADIEQLTAIYQRILEQFFAARA